MCQIVGNDLDGIKLRLTGRLTADAYGVHVFPGGQMASDPLSWASQLRQEFGSRVKIYGFWCFENPLATTLNELRERHDFAVLDDRWIIDFWLARHYPEEYFGVVDLQDEQSCKGARALYGDPGCWERDFDMETRMDRQSSRRISPILSSDQSEHVAELHS